MEEKNLILSFCNYMTIIKLFSFISKLQNTKKIYLYKTHKKFNKNGELYENFFDFEISTIYFSYIFDYNKLNKKKIKNIKYIFYDSHNFSFYEQK